MGDVVPHPAFREKVHTSFAKQGLMEALGGKLMLVDPGHVQIELPYSDASPSPRPARVSSPTPRRWPSR